MQDKERQRDDGGNAHHGFTRIYEPVTARRILLVKQTDNAERSMFLQQKGNLKSYDELSEIERLYYSYTCREGDVIRMCNIPTPQMTTDDLTLEKKILELSKL